MWLFNTQEAIHDVIVLAMEVKSYVMCGAHTKQREPACCFTKTMSYSWVGPQQEYSLELNLYGEVDTDASKINVSPRKIFIVIEVGGDDDRGAIFWLWND